MRTHVNRAFARLERRIERTLAALRLLALAALTLIFWFVGLAEQGHATAVPLGGLAVTTLIGLTTARMGRLRARALWLLATADVGLLIHCLALLANTTGQSLQLALETPVALLIFVLLATAAVRHRPPLILYTGGLFVAGWTALWLLAPYAGSGSWTPGTLTANVARLTVIGVTTFALFVAVTRAREASTTAIVEGHLRTNLSRYFSPQIVDEIAQSGDAARSFRAQKAAILFADLRGFTSLAEGMPAGEVADFLNDYRRRIAEPIAQHHGAIDKFIGDGVMAIFGVPEPSADDARNAVFAGLGLVAAIDRWRDERVARGLAPVEIGIGIHYGDVIAGALGDEQRLEYTVVGDAVNTAARIERLAADLATPLLISADVLAAAPGIEHDLSLTALPESSLRGRRQPVQLYRWNMNAAA